METEDIYDGISVLQYRYREPRLRSYLSENAYTGYKLRIELALLQALSNHEICGQEVVEEVSSAIPLITTSAVYGEENRIHHDIRALVNVLKSKVSERCHPFIHLGATSYDIISSAEALRTRDATLELLVPTLTSVVAELIKIVIAEAKTVQMGRTHGQHAVPITFGFAMSEYVSRLGQRILLLGDRARALPGKFSGAVGGHHIIRDLLPSVNPLDFEREVLEQVGLLPLDYSTQIVQPECMADHYSQVVQTAGVLANLADDIRNLQRTEIGEVTPITDRDQVGSSTMPNKKNPIDPENVKSLWKVAMPRMMTLYMDQISEHQRDLTNSASGRTYPEIECFVVIMAIRTIRYLRRLQVNREKMAQNLELTGDLCLAERVYAHLARVGHPDAHEAVRVITEVARKENKRLLTAAQAVPELRPYLMLLKPADLDALKDLGSYVGITPQIAHEVATSWADRLGIQ